MVDTFLTTLYVMVEDFCKARLPQRRRPGPEASLSQAEVVTLAIFSQWARFGSERSFYRYATEHLRDGLSHSSCQGTLQPTAPTSP